MQSLSTLIKDNKQLTVNSNINKFNLTVNSYTAKDILPILSNYEDLIPDDHRGWYVKRLKEIGRDRFIELANKARAGSDTPERLFNWMLKNNEAVR